MAQISLAETAPHSPVTRDGLFASNWYRERSNDRIAPLAEVHSFIRLCPGRARNRVKYANGKRPP